MEYLNFPEQNPNQYRLDGSLFEHSKISENNRAKLFIWLSQECSKQRISRFTFVLTCSYIDLILMRTNDIPNQDYQLLALGALIIATKQMESNARLPLIDISFFQLDRLLGMEKKIILILNYDINPPIYVELINNLAMMWDSQCEKGHIDSEVRYFKGNRESYHRLRNLYEKMDFLNLFKRILDFKINEVVLTLFYIHTRSLDAELSIPSQILPINPEQQKDFRQIFRNFLIKSQIETKTNEVLEKIITTLTSQNFSAQYEGEPRGRSFNEILSLQTHNPNRFQLFATFRSIIRSL